MSRNRNHIILALIATFALLFSACGSDSAADDSAADDSAADDSAADDSAADDSAADDSAADDSTTAVETTSPDAGAETTEPADAPVEEESEALAVSLFEWVVEAPTTITGGSVTFDVTNTGTFPHEFAIARGDSYETLPQLDNGAVDEETLGDDWLGRTDRVAPGETTTISFDLEPGNYVFMCNINSGPNAHASQGQVLSVTVN